MRTIEAYDAERKHSTTRPIAPGTVLAYWVSDDRVTSVFLGVGQSEEEAVSGAKAELRDADLTLAGGTFECLLVVETRE